MRHIRTFIAVLLGHTGHDGIEDLIDFLGLIMVLVLLLYGLPLVGHLWMTP